VGSAKPWGSHTGSTVPDENRFERTEEKSIDPSSTRQRELDSRPRLYRPGPGTWARQGPMSLEQMREIGRSAAGRR
jgi:hypothetical protein